MSLAARIVDWFLEAPDPADGSEPPEAATRGFVKAPVTPWSAPVSASSKPSDGWAVPLIAAPAASVRWSPPVAADAVAFGESPALDGAELLQPAPRSAAVVGADPRAVMPVAAAVAGELRVRAGAPAAVVALWRRAAVGEALAGAVAAGSAAGSPTPRPATPAGAAIPAARRLEARLADEAFGPVTACGRVAWVLLPAAPGEAAAAAARLLDGSDAPVVVAVCGARPCELEPVLAGRDVAVAVLPQDADPDLRALALAALAAPSRSIHAPLQAGPPRWAALAGLARLRSLPLIPQRELGG